MPRRENLWVFGSWGGHRFADNAAAYFAYCRERAPDADLVWISRNRSIINELRAAGCNAHHCWSIAGAWACLRARVHFFDCFSKDTNFWLSRGAVKVCLWSGVPLKVFERDIDNADSRYFKLFHGSAFERFVLSMMMPWHVVRPDWIIAMSEETRDITARAFDVPRDRVLTTGFPRNDLFMDAAAPTPLPQPLPEPMRAALRAKRRIILYLPTFRDSGRPFTRIDWLQLDALMEQLDATFFFKFHPLDDSEIDHQLQRVFEIPRDRDVYDLLPAFDVLISDYSSIIFDFMLLRRPVVSYTPDLDEFLADCRSLLFHPEEIATSPLCHSYAELAQRLEAIITGQDPGDPAKYESVLTRLHQHVDGKAAQRIYDSLGERLGVADAPVPPAMAAKTNRLDREAADAQADAG